MSTQTVSKSTIKRLNCQAVVGRSLQEYGEAKAKQAKAMISREVCERQLNILKHDIHRLIQAAQEEGAELGFLSWGDKDVDIPRKPHVRVDQYYYYEYIKDYGPQTIETLAAAFDVHESTARRQLDGLMFQGKLHRELKSPWTHTVYHLKENNGAN